MEVLLVEQMMGGHHQIYLKLYTEFFVGLGHKVNILYPDSNGLIGLLDEDIRKKSVVYRIDEYRNINVTPKRFSQTINCLKMFYTVRKYIKKYNLNPDLVFFMYLDSALCEYNSKPFKGLPNSIFYSLIRHLITLIFPYRWTGILFNPNRVDKNISRILNKKYVRSIVTLQNLLSAKSYIKNYIDIFEMPDVITTDIQENSRIVDEIKLKANKRTKILLIGSINIAKTPVLLLKAAELMDPSKYYFIFVGQLCESCFTSEKKQFLEREINSRENCILFPERIRTESEFNIIIKNADMVYAVYKDFTISSNILQKAAYFHKNILVNEVGCMGELVKKYMIGETVNILNPINISEKLKILSNKKIDDSIFNTFIKSRNLNSLENKLKGLCNSYY